MPSRDRDETGSRPSNQSPRRDRADATPAIAPRTVVVGGATIRVPGTFAHPRAATTPPGCARGDATPVAASRARADAASPRAASPREGERPAAQAAPAPRTSAEPRTVADVRPEDLAPDVRRLLWYHLDSAEKIGVLQYARAAALPWTTPDVAASLGVPERAIVVATVGLCRAELLRRHGDTYQRTPKASFLGAALDVLQCTCGADPAQMLGAIARLAHGR
jgi:hypothetical protein